MVLTITLQGTIIDGRFKDDNYTLEFKDGKMQLYLTRTREWLPVDTWRVVQDTMAIPPMLTVTVFLRKEVS